MIIKAWHGTLAQQGEFEDFSKHEGFISFCTERDWAREHAAPEHLGWINSSKLFEVTLNVRKILDFRLIEHSNLIKSYLNSINFTHFSEDRLDYWVNTRGAYQCIEHIPLLEENGFDAAYTCEGGWLNIHTPYKELIEIHKIYTKDPGKLTETLESGVRKTPICGDFGGYGIN